MTDIYTFKFADKLYTLSSEFSFSYENSYWQCEFTQDSFLYLEPEKVADIFSKYYPIVREILDILNSEECWGDHASIDSGELRLTTEAYLLDSSNRKGIITTSFMDNELTVYFTAFDYTTQDEERILEQQSYKEFMDLREMGDIHNRWIKEFLYLGSE